LCAILVLAATGWVLFRSIEVIKGITKGQLFGIGISQIQAELSFTPIVKSVVVSQDAKVVQNDLSIFDQLKVGDDVLIACCLFGRVNTAKHRNSSDHIIKSALWGDGLNWPKFQPPNSFLRRTFDGNIGQSITRRSLNSAGRGSSAIEENYHGWHTAGLTKISDASFKNSNPRPLFSSEGILRVLNGQLRIISSSLRGGSGLVGGSLEVARACFKNTSGA
jgi:hypothetical protein